MKKSMLLTTIAMIVVVVVALSTATFAWFSSFTTVSSAAQVSVTAGSAGIEVREAGASTQWTNALTDTTCDNLTPVAPKADLAAFNAPSTQAYTANLGGTDGFFTAIKKSVSGTNKIVVGAPVTANTHYVYKEFQVRNGATTATNIVLTVTVKAQADTTDNAATNDATDADKYAIDNCKIVVVTATGVGGATGAIAGSTFNYGMTGASSDTAYNENTEYADNNLGTASGNVTSDTTTAQAFVASSKDYSKVYTTTWASVADNKAENWRTVGVYVWLDGHAVDNYAAGAALDIIITVNKA